MFGRGIGLLVLTSMLATSSAWAGNNDDPGREGFNRFSGGPAISPLPQAPPERPKQRPAQDPQRMQETVAALRAQEEATFLRRIHVCDRLKKIALETGDQQLEAQALRLEERASEVYKLRLNKISTNSLKTARGDQP
jgi:hypothetical protein